jgi:hypothetical protein
MVNLSFSIPFDVASWLEKYAVDHNLLTNGKPSIGKAASIKLQQQHIQESKLK